MENLSFFAYFKPSLILLLKIPLLSDTCIMADIRLKIGKKAKNAKNKTEKQNKNDS